MLLTGLMNSRPPSAVFTKHLLITTNPYYSYRNVLLKIEYKNSYFLKPLFFQNNGRFRAYSTSNSNIAIKQEVGLFIKPLKKFESIKNKWTIYLKLYTIPVILILFLANCVTIIPPGYVGILDNIDGSILPYVSEGKMVLLHTPFYQKGITMRISPIRRKIIKSFTTKDGRSVEAVVFCTLQAKPAYAAEIYLHFGNHFSKSFAEKEMEFDLSKAVEKYDFDDFFNENPDTVAEYNQNILQYDRLILKKTKLDCIKDELLERFDDAGKFHKIDVSNVTISFREPTPTD